MKRILFGIIFIALSLGAQAVDVTITLSASQATRAAAVCGKRMRLQDSQGVPRSCTMAEAKVFLISMLKEAVADSEREDADKARAVTAFEPT